MATCEKLRDSYFFDAIVNQISNMARLNWLWQQNKFLEREKVNKT